MEIENKILEILDLVREKVLSPDEALPHIFSVVGRSEELLAYTEWLKKEGLLNATVSKLIVKKYQRKLSPTPDEITPIIK